MSIIKKPVGIVSYGTYLPEYAVNLSEIEQGNGKSIGLVSSSLAVDQKTVADFDEDTATMAIQAGYQALKRALQLKGFDPNTIKALFVGSESHPYAVKPTGTVVANALGLSEKLAMADLQFACKAGTQAMLICASYVLAGLAKFGLAIGADVAQAKSGDALEYTAGAGAGAFLFGNKNLIARLIATTSVASDKPDFWRVAGETYPSHAGRFTGEPAYFYHVMRASQDLLAETNLKPADFAHCVFHTPNGKFPRQVAKKLGFSQQQINSSLVVGRVGNTYAGSVPLALANVLDVAQPGQKIFITAYGSGAGADSFIFETTANLTKQRVSWSRLVEDQIKALKPILYLDYLKLQHSRHH